MSTCNVIRIHTCVVVPVAFYDIDVFLTFLSISVFEKDSVIYFNRNEKQTNCFSEIS